MNLPNGSFRDYANAVLNPPQDLICCDSCNGECTEPHDATTEAGDVTGTFCCVCAYKHAPKAWECCEECEKRRVA